ncbi:hypothetical protein MACK_002403 [Theileria orientalis]|uniref:Uncharacterized protein n=1 Tax=Theileria orientalis TaxID=68886 RepID=A0A976QT39_THEOR|nr:hypothetical protein MACK_002403 [Theileria orientalis]
MAHNYLKRYYRLDLYSSCIFPVFLLYQILFSDNTKSVDVLLKKTVTVHMFINTIMLLYHLLVLPFLVFGGNFRLLAVLTKRLFMRRVDYGSYLSSKLTGSEDLKQRQSIQVEITIFILRHRLKDKILLLVQIFLFFLFLTFGLTTNNSLVYLLNYTYMCMLFVTVYFGTIIHFILLPNSDFIDGYSRYLVNSNTGEGLGFQTYSTEGSGFTRNFSSEMENKFLLNHIEDNIVLNYEHSPMLYTLCIIQVVLGVFGVCFGNYLLLLDWYQLFARFPVTTYVGIFVGHLLSSVACNLALMGGRGSSSNLPKGREYSNNMERKSGESENVKRPRRGFIEFLLG